MSSTKIRTMFMRGEDISAVTHPDFVAYLRSHNITLAPPAAVATPFHELVATIYQPRSDSGVKLPLADAWHTKIESVAFHALQPGEGTLGQGRQAITSLMKLGEMRVAVKRAHTVRQSDLKIIARELYFLALLKPHPHVVNIIGAGTSPEGTGALLTDVWFTISRERVLFALRSQQHCVA